jgi:hypothetical protein
VTTSRYAGRPADTDWLEELMVVPADRREAFDA